MGDMRVGASNSAWPPIRRLVWYALFIALIAWSTMLNPTPGVFVEPLPIVGYVSV